MNALLVLQRSMFLTLFLTLTAHALEPRIVGGKTAEAGQWPWMVALIASNESSAYWGQKCGGSLIHPTWVLTAGHCLDGETADSLDVLVGRTNLTATDGQRIKVKRLVRHPDFSTTPLHSDVALIELAEAVTNLPPVTLSETFAWQPAANSMTMVMGWGALDTSQRTYATNLQQVELPLIDDAECQATFPGEITSTMFCAGFKLGGRDACLGDSGGPLLMLDENQHWRQYGIISWGEGCALSGYYGVYTRVAAIYQFIADTLCDAAAPAPLLQLQQNASAISLNWRSDTAEGFRLYYAPYSNPLTELTWNHILSLDLRHTTKLDLQLYPGAQFYVTMRGYQGVCHSQFAPALSVIVE